MVTRLTTYDRNVSAYACVYVLSMLFRVLVYLCSAVLVIAGRIAIGRRCLIYLRRTVDAITYMCRCIMNEMGQNRLREKPKEVGQGLAQTLRW